MYNRQYLLYLSDLLVFIEKSVALFGGGKVPPSKIVKNWPLPWLCMESTSYRAYKPVYWQVKKSLNKY